jgi:hypothetical protein
VKNNFIARFLERRNRLFENWKSGVVLLAISVSALSFSLPAAIAEERKTLEELLIEKGVLTQEEVAAIQGRKVSKWVDRVTFFGDLRLRHEDNMKDPGLDYHRDRFRLRIGAEIKFDDFLLGTRLASGNGSQVSTNQTFGKLFSQKQISIDLAYLQWKGLPWITVTAGKMINPFYTIPDVVWDVDANPEGLAENFQLKLSDSLVLFANAGQFILDEKTNDNNIQYLFGEQAGVQAGLGKALQITMAGAFYNFKNINRSDIAPVATQPGNTRVVTGAGVLTSQLFNAYRVLDLNTEIMVKVLPIPISLIGDYVRNLATTTTGKNNGYQAGGRIGKANDPQTWEVGYFYRVMETDATVADLTDSDFAEGGTNRKGHIIWAAYQFNKAIQLRTRYFATKPEDELLPHAALVPVASSLGPDKINKFQVDLIARF